MLPLAQINPSTNPGALPPLPEGPDLSQLRPPAPLESAPVSLWLLLLLIVLAPLAAFLFRRLRSGRPPAPPPDPRAEALAAIDAADRNHADAHELAGCCAAALRRLLQQRFNLRQTGLTPHELTTRLPIERPAKAALRDFFDQCERLQFAGAPLSPEARQALLATARHLVAEYADPPIQAEEVHPA